MNLDVHGCIMHQQLVYKPCSPTYAQTHHSLLLTVLLFAWAWSFSFSWMTSSARALRLWSSSCQEKKQSQPSFYCTTNYSNTVRRMVGMRGCPLMHRVFSKCIQLSQRSSETSAQVHKAKRHLRSHQNRCLASSYNNTSTSLRRHPNHLSDIFRRTQNC